MIFLWLIFPLLLSLSVWYMFWNVAAFYSVCSIIYYLFILVVSASILASKLTTSVYRLLPVVRYQCAGRILFPSLLTYKAHLWLQKAERAYSKLWYFMFSVMWFQFLCHLWVYFSCVYLILRLYILSNTSYIVLLKAGIKLNRLLFFLVLRNQFPDI